MHTEHRGCHTSHILCLYEEENGHKICDVNLIRLHILCYFNVINTYLNLFKYGCIIFHAQSLCFYMHIYLFKVVFI